MPSNSAQPERPEATPNDFVEVYEGYFRYVWHTLRRLGVPQSDLEDAAHDVFVVVHRKFGDYDRERPIKPWLSGISARVASDRRRRAFRRREVVVDEVRKPSSGPTPERQAEKKDAKRLVGRALERLPDEQRVVFVMADIDGFSAPDISRELGVPLNTVYSRLRLARKKFASAVQALRR